MSSSAKPIIFEKLQSMGIAEFIIGRAFARPIGLTHAQYQESGGDALAETAGNVQPIKPVANGGDRDVVGCGRRSAQFDRNLGLHESGHAVAGRLLSREFQFGLVDLFAKLLRFSELPGDIVRH